MLLLQQDIRGLDLYGSSAAMVCVCDGMNYLLDEDSLYKTLCRVRMFLDHGGIFIFDMKTRYFYENVLGSRVIAENRDINDYLITVYNLVDKENDLFERFDELHMQRAYPVEKVKELINKAGLETAAVYNAFTKEEPSGTSERIYFVAKRV